MRFSLGKWFCGCFGNCNVEEFNAKGIMRYGHCRSLNRIINPIEFIYIVGQYIIFRGQIRPSIVPFKIHAIIYLILIVRIEQPYNHFKIHYLVNGHDCAGRQRQLAAGRHILIRITSLNDKWIAAHPAVLSVVVNNRKSEHFQLLIQFQRKTRNQGAPEIEPGPSMA